MPAEPAKRTCSVPRCREGHEARGYCVAHYRRWRLYGDPTAGAPPGGPVYYPSALTAAGLARHRADHWARVGYLKVPLGPDGRKAWTDVEVRVAALMAKLIDVGFEAAKAAKIAREVVTTGRERWIWGRPAQIHLKVAEPAADRAITRW